MRYKVKITMENESSSASSYEVANTLRSLIEKVEWGDSFDKSLFDLNGNKIGHVKIKFKEA